MFGPLNSRHLPAAQAALRIFAGAAFFSHGAQKLLGWFGGMGPDGGTVELMSKFGAAGVIELVGGALLVLGLGTRLVAFIASGEMAVAYWWMHAGGSGKIFWWENRGETGDAVLLHLAGLRGVGRRSATAWTLAGVAEAGNLTY